MDVVVDTNVAMVASQRHDRADEPCIHACIVRLDQIMKGGGLILDEDGLILREYLNNLGLSGQPGAGEAFARWAFDNQFTDRTVRVRITRRAGDGWRRFDEFPEVATLARFDPSDQKFAAVAIASGTNPKILNAVDSDWWEHRDALADAGVRVEFLCPHHMARR